MIRSGSLTWISIKIKVDGKSAISSAKHDLVLEKTGERVRELSPRFDRLSFIVAQEMHQFSLTDVIRYKR